MTDAVRPPPKIHPLSLGLLGLAGLAALSVRLWPLDLGAPAAPPGASSLDLPGLAAAETGAVLARPLFDPQRRAWTARGSREDLTAEARPPTLLSVRGILIENGARRALVKEGDGAPAWMSPGDGQGAWRLVSVEPNHVVVADPGRQYTLAFLGPPVALRPVPRHPEPEAPKPMPEAPKPGPEAPSLRLTRDPGETAPPVPPETGAPAAVPPRAPVRRIAIDPAGR